jgi:hypothetical protein
MILIDNWLVHKGILAVPLMQVLSDALASQSLLQHRLHFNSLNIQPSAVYSLDDDSVVATHST